MSSTYLSTSSSQLILAKRTTRYAIVTTEHFITCSQTSTHSTVERCSSLKSDLRSHDHCETTYKVRATATMAAWRSGNIVGRINEVTLRRTRLVLGWVTVFGWQTTSVFHQAT